MLRFSSESHGYLCHLVTVFDNDREGRRIWRNHTFFNSSIANSWETRGGRRVRGKEVNDHRAVGGRSLTDGEKNLNLLLRNKPRAAYPEVKDFTKIPAGWQAGEKGEDP